MQDALGPYLKKRDFSKTGEPAGGTSSTPGLSFVVQKHAASHLHYDFRLELNGTLKSWAVPKGPSLDPLDKRMAVHVEDHPVEYGRFEGVIPKGQYGGGSVIVWDNGTWEPIGDALAGYAAGKLKFRLLGKKLTGGWTLVRMHGRAAERQEPWLLIKERDEAARPSAQYNVLEAEPSSVLSGRRILDPVPKASSSPAARAKSVTPSRKLAEEVPIAHGKISAKRPAPRKTASSKASTTVASTALALPLAAKKAALPDTLMPQLATLVVEAPQDDGWIYEIKFDGYRLLTRIDGDDVRLLTRNGNDWSSRMGSLVSALRALGMGSAWLDGEIVVAGDNGAPDFNLLQNAFDSSRSESIQYYLFDLPFFGGHDLRAVPLVERRALLRRLLDATPVQDRIRFSEDFHTSPKELLHNACRMRLEGVIGKRADSPYVPRRSPTWIKLKCTQRQEFVVGGYTDPRGSRTAIGSLLLGVYDEAGALHFAGAVGSGFDGPALKSVKKALSVVDTDKMPFLKRPPGKAHWVQPALVAEVSFSEWTPDGRIRHAVFHGLRDDKPPRAIVREQAVPVKAVAGARVKASGSRRVAATSVDRFVEGVRISSPDRVIDTSSGSTKLDIVNYYLAVCRLILPHLATRPVSLVRAPAGIDGQLFFQKHAGSLKIADLKELDQSIAPDLQPMVEVDSFTALIGAAQANVIEFHTWNATTRDTTRPDRMIFDLDPGEGVTWKQIQQGAELTRSLLDHMGLASFLKTSGGKGLHVVVPFAPKEGWDTVKAFSKEIVAHLARTVPDRFVAKSGPKNRLGKIFVDYLRNGFGATTACAWSARARAGLGISVPCTWDELGALTGGAHWTVRTVEQRLDERDDAWSGYAASRRQSLVKGMNALGLKRVNT